MATVSLPCPPAVRRLLALFASHGEAAYPVGGCVRDALMGIPPHDWDVAVTTVPERTQEICEAEGLRVIPTGMTHGTVTVLLPTDQGERIPVECTTCRTEGGYADGRHPDAVTFTGLIEDDLSRRDFTVNALAAEISPNSENAFEIIDLFGGRDDLQNKVIRCVGDPHTRLTEDALRILRAVRFAVKLGFDIEPATRQALVDCAHGLARISRERIRDEFEKILCSPDPTGGVHLLMELGLMPYVLPHGIAPDGTGDLADLPADFTVRAACLLRGMNTAAVKEDLRNLRLSNEILDHTLLLQSTPLPSSATPRAARDLRQACGELALPLLLIERAKGNDTAALMNMVHTSRAKGECVSLSALAVDGKTLIELGIPAGKSVGQMLSTLLELVMDDPAKNTKETLINEAKKRI